MSTRKLAIIKTKIKSLDVLLDILDVSLEGPRSIAKEDSKTALKETSLVQLSGHTDFYLENDTGNILYCVYLYFKISKYRDLDQYSRGKNHFTAYHNPTGRPFC